MDDNGQDSFHRPGAAGESPDPDMTRHQNARRLILKKRAQELAAPETAGEKKECPLEVVVFRLADETYALECQYTREVSRLKSVTPIPGTPAFVPGIITIRGQIVSIIDLEQFFELPAKKLSDPAWVIVLENETMEFGILAEEIVGATSIPAGEIQPPLPTLTGIRAEYLMGIAKNRLIILDAAKLLADEKIIINQELEI